MLSKLWSAFGAQGISEPDFFTQFALLAQPTQENLQLLKVTSDELLVPICAQGIDTVLLKMRSQANYGALKILAALWDRHCPHDLLDTLEIRHR